MEANLSLARRRPSTENDQAVSTMTNSTAAVTVVVAQPVQDSR